MQHYFFTSFAYAADAKQQTGLSRQMRPLWKVEIKRYLMVLSGLSGACFAEQEKACISVAFLPKLFDPHFFAPPEPTMVASVQKNTG